MKNLFHRYKTPIGMACGVIAVRLFLELQWLWKISLLASLTIYLAIRYYRDERRHWRLIGAIAAGWLAIHATQRDFVFSLNELKVCVSGLATPPSFDIAVIFVLVALLIDSHQTRV